MTLLPRPLPQALDTWASWLQLPFRKRLRCAEWWLLLSTRWHLPAGATSSSNTFAAATLRAQSSQAPSHVSVFRAQKQRGGGYLLGP